MFTSLTLFQNASAMARHAAFRQALVAENMANSDTPGHVPKDLPEFSQFVARSAPARAATLDDAFRTSTFEERSGFGVSIEAEMLRSVDAKRQHDRAMAIYKSGLGILRASLGRR